MLDRRVSPLRPPVKKRKPAPPAGPQMHEVKSSFLRTIGHQDGRLHVEMHDGGRYDFPGTAEELEAWKAAISPGAFFQLNIRGREFNKTPKKAA
jgi:hypothetical protein